MIEFNNKHIVLIIIIIIVVIFIINYDVYVISKNESICKPLYVTKREISPEIRAELNKIESNVLKETFTNLSANNNYEEFTGLSSIPQINLPENLQSILPINLNQNLTLPNIYDIPPKTFSEFTIPSITNSEKLKVIDSVIKILSYIPTNYCETQIKQLIEYFAIIYETSADLETFYKNVGTSTKIKEYPYNSKYSHLILFLIGKFDSDYSNCTKQYSNNNNCALNELMNKMQNNPTLKNTTNTESQKFNNCETNLILPSNNNNLNIENKPIISNNTFNQPTKYIQESSHYYNESNNNIPTNIISNNNNLNIENKPIISNNTFNQPTNMIPNIIPEQLSNNHSNILNYNNSENPGYPSYNNNSENSGYPTIYPSNTLNELYNPTPSYKLPKNNNQNQIVTNEGKTSCGGKTCSYKCDSSYSSAISYLDNQLKPLESFGMLSDSPYASFY